MGVDDVDCTEMIQLVAESNSVEAWDFPGEHPLRNLQTIKTVTQIKKLHLIVLVYVDAVENVYLLSKYIHACGTKFVIVRNKCDTINDMERAKQSDQAKVDQFWTELQAAQGGSGNEAQAREGASGSSSSNAELQAAQEGSGEDAPEVLFCSKNMPDTIQKFKDHIESLDLGFSFADQFRGYPLTERRVLSGDYES